MTKLYKLTDKDGRTQGKTQWGPGVSHSGTGEGELCGPGWIHAYEHPLIAVLLNPIHGGFGNDMRLWEAEGNAALRDGQLKCGCKTLTTVREIPVPKITTEQRVRFAILCVKEVCNNRKWNTWADKCLSGEDRSAAAEAAWVAAAEAAWEAAWVAAEVAAEARSAAKARAAAWAAKAAAKAAAEAAAWAAEAAEVAAEAEIDLFAIAEEACEGLT